MNGFFLYMILLVAGDDFSQGERAFAEARYPDALAAFTVAEEKAGPEASAQLLFNRALAALLAKAFVEAEACMERAAARGGDDFEAYRDFIRGNAAFARCEVAAEVACQPEAEPFAFDVAIMHVRKAEAFWRKATMTRDDWPEARRNVERAQRKQAALLELKKERQKKLRSLSQPQVRPQLLPQANGAGDDEGEIQDEEAQIEAQRTELTSQQIKSLYDKLGEKEEEKRKLRWARLEKQKVKADKDW